jgi:hypothetical protein
VLGRFGITGATGLPTANNNILDHFDWIDSLPADIDELSSLVSDIEPDHKGVPVMLRQYVKLGGKLVGFTVDACFNDGLIIVDLAKCDRKILDRYMGKTGAEAFLAYHDRRQEDLAS